MSWDSCLFSYFYHPFYALYHLPHLSSSLYILCNISLNLSLTLCIIRSVFYLVSCFCLLSYSWHLLLCLLPLHYILYDISFNSCLTFYLLRCLFFLVSHLCLLLYTFYLLPHLLLLLYFLCITSFALSLSFSLVVFLFSLKCDRFASFFSLYYKS